MQKRMKWTVVAVAIVALLGSTACVTKKVYRKDMEQNDSRIKGVESGVEQNERRVEDLGKETDRKISEVRGTAEKAVEIGNSALSKAAAAEKAARGKILWETTLSDDRVKFSFDAASIPAEAQTILNDLASKVKGMDKAVYVEIEGHTDNIGNETYNLELGQKRAEAVRNYLSTQGLPLHAMSVISYGEANPVAENDSKEGRSKNRRVVVRVLE